MKKKIFLLLILLTTFLTGCANIKTKDVFRFEAHEVNLIVGEAIEIKVILGSVGPKEELVYIIGNSTIISYEENILTALSAGITKITVYVKDEPLTRAAVNVNVKNEPISSLKINGINALLIGDTTSFTVEVTPSHLSNKVTWKSSDPKVATINAVGVLTAIKAGKVTISATSTYDKSIVAVKNVEVKYHDATQIDIAFLNGKATMVLTEAAKLTATVLPARANPAYTWKTSDAKIVSVDVDGNLTALSVGTATITVTSADGLAESTVDITVVWADATSITVKELTGDIYVNDTFKIEAIVEPANANQKVAITFNNELLAQQENNILTFIAEGVLEVTVKSTDGKAEKKFTVIIKPIPAPTDIEFKTADGATTFDEKKSNISLVIEIKPEHALQEYEIASSDENVATVTAKGNGYVLNTKNPGTVTITVTSKVNPTLKKSITIIVTAIE
ncbi:MAG TPA: Ig-like domain-containing protein [Bacilli bacterium]|nr:Ig-like domain-containing protein [Bacilli bacterium]